MEAWNKIGLKPHSCDIMRNYNNTPSNQVKTIFYKYTHNPFKTSCISHYCFMRRFIFRKNIESIQLPNDAPKTQERTNTATIWFNGDHFAVSHLAASSKKAKWRFRKEIIERLEADYLKIEWFSLISLEISYLWKQIKKSNPMKMNRIKEALQEKRLTQVWLAKELDKSFKMVNAYACNRKQPSIETLFRIADLLQISAKDLIVDNIRK